VLQTHADICDNLVPIEIALRCARAVIEGQPFAAYIIIPMWPEGGFARTSGACDIMLDMQLWQYWPSCQWLPTPGSWRMSSLHFPPKRCPFEGGGRRSMCTWNMVVVCSFPDPKPQLALAPCRHSGGGQRAGGAAVADRHHPHDVPHRGKGHPAQGAVCAHQPHPWICAQKLTHLQLALGTWPTMAPTTVSVHAPCGTLGRLTEPI
jgi:hypothetical protein